METSIRINRKTFLQSLLILFALMILAGILTRVVPAGSYTRLIQGERQVVDPQSFRSIPRPDYPVWRWFTAPLEVLWGPDGMILITILLFLILIGVAFAVLEKTGLLGAAVGWIVQATAGRKYLLLLAISFFFMATGAFFGIFEEVIPLVPLMVALSYSLGWDALVGLGMSILATNMGFSAAITNPFTIGVAQRLAGLPLFSGAWLRIVIFLAIYIVLAVFLARYARRIERPPEEAPGGEEKPAGGRYFPPVSLSQRVPHMGRALVWLSACLVLILATLFSTPFVPAIAQFSLPLVGLLFFLGGMGAGFLSGAPGKAVLASAKEGALSVLPAIPLVLMAASAKHIVTQGGILDTLLNRASQSINQTSPLLAALLVYLLVLLMDFFVTSGSAKAFLIMPVLLPLADLVGVTRQVAVTAYCFGDGFSNLAYPTSPVLLICLGLTVVSYPKWLKWTLGLWPWVFLITVFFLAIGVWIGYGPF